MESINLHQIIILSFVFFGWIVVLFLLMIKALRGHNNNGIEYNDGLKKTILYRSFRDYLIVKKSPFTSYFYSQRKGIDSIAFILVDKNKKDKKFAVINERKPSLDEFFNKEVFLETAFGGSNDNIKIKDYLQMNEEAKIEHHKQTVKHEVIEESGYDVSIERINFISKEFVSTQQNQFCYLFIVDVSNLEQGTPQWTNEAESMSTVVWKSKDEIMQGNDWKSKVIISCT